MLLKVLTRSLAAGRRRLAVAAAALLLAATLVAALSALSLEMRSKAGKELEAYGPNVALLPRSVFLPAGGNPGAGDITREEYIPAGGLSYLETGEAVGIAAYAPYLYTVASLQGQKTVVSGVLFDQLRVLAPYWQVKGDWPASGPGSAMIGKNVAERFSLQPGDEIRLQFERESAGFRVLGVADVGGSEDNQVFIDLKSLQALSGRAGQIDVVQIRAAAGAGRLVDIAAGLERNIPGVEARVIGQIAEAEARVLSRIQLLIALLTAAVLLAAALAVFSTVSASVLERTREIGLMKAMGARNCWIMLLFLAEAWVVALGAAAAGCILGFGLAQIIGASVFSTHLSFRGESIPLTLAAVLLVATLASLWPVRNALAVEPITALRSE